MNIGSLVIIEKLLYIVVPLYVSQLHWFQFYHSWRNEQRDISSVFSCEVDVTFIELEVS